MVFSNCYLPLPHLLLVTRAESGIVFLFGFHNILLLWFLIFKEGSEEQTSNPRQVMDFSVDMMHELYESAFIKDLEAIFARLYVKPPSHSLPFQVIEDIPELIDANGNICT